MTRKDYVKMAEIVRVANGRYGSGQIDGVGEPYTDMPDGDTIIKFFVSELVDLFAADNPRFDRNRFAKACEVKA